VTLTIGVHRIVESHAATRGNEVAVIARDGTLTYRELNQRANALARYLIGEGFRRGLRAVVKMERCPDLAVVLLAVLKAGGAYTWLDRSDGGTWPCGISFVQRPDEQEERYFVIDIRQAQVAAAAPAPNLPILTRAADIACVLPQRNGLPGVLVPHATITALQSHPLPETARWSSECGALDLWLPLMAGATVTLAAPAEAAAA
jgi:non-ribosomal peptide synthetase component F